MENPVARWIGVDYGTRRIGLALSDPGQRIASPATTLQAAGSPTQDARRVVDWARENEGGGIVVGLPLNMADGSDSAQTRMTRAFADALEKQGDLPVVLHDERLSSFAADQVLDAGQIPPKRRKALRDAIAAQVILQSFLDASRNQGADDAPAGDAGNDVG